MTKALILSIVLVIVWGSSSIVGASPRVDKQLGQLITLTMKETSVINIIQEIRKSTCEDWESMITEIIIYDKVEGF